MTFVKYQNTNNADSSLIAWISASATTIMIVDWDQNLFPSSFPFLLTLEKLDSDWNVIAREIVKATAWNQNSFTVVRWAWTCVQDDTASNRVQWSAKHSFSAWDKISLYFTSEQVKDIQDELQTKLSIAEYQSWNYVYWASTTWNDDYAITLPVAPTSYTIWQVFRFLAWTWNIWPATLNVNWLWAVAIKKNHDLPLDTWDIEEWQIVEVAYDWTNFQMNSQTATIVDMKDIKTTSFSWLKAWQDLQEWDVVQVANKWFDWSVATSSTSLWWTSSIKWWIWFTSNWESIKDLQIKASIVDWTTPTAITIKLETDNSGSPSWTALWSVDALNSFSWNININSITESTTDYYWEQWAYIQHFWWWNLWKTRCFYSKYNVWNIASDWLLTIWRYFLNENWTAPEKSVWYDIPASTFLSVLWLSWTQTYTILYIDQDFEFMFVYVASTDKIYKFWFNAPTTWWRIWHLDILWSRPKSILSFSYITSKTQIAFSDDWMFAYIITTTDDNASWDMKCFSLNSPYDLTWATHMWTDRSIWTYWIWPAYMSLKWWKKYVIAWFSWNTTIKAREINSDWTIGSTDITIRSWPSANFSNMFWIWNKANWWAAIWVPYYYNSSTKSTVLYTLWTAFFTTSSLIDFSFSNSIPTTAWEKYWITIAPTWWSVSNFVNLYSYEWNEFSSLSLYTDSWNASTNKSPYLRWTWIQAMYILKQIDPNISFWNYWIADNEYNAFSNARFVNMWYSEHFQSLIAWRKYFMKNWKLSLDWWQYIWIAVNERTLQIWNWKDESAKFHNIVSAPATTSSRSWSNQYGSFVAKTDWYYTAMWNVASTTDWAKLRFFVNWSSVNESISYRSSSWTETSFVVVSAYMKKWDVWSLSTNWTKNFAWVFIIWPDWSI